MIDHDRQLVDFLAGELTGSELLAFESHLDMCDECRQALREDDAGRQLVASLRTPLERAVIGRLTARLDSATSAPAARGRALVLAAAAAIVLLVVVTGLVWTGRGAHPSTATPKSVVVQLLGGAAAVAEPATSSMQTITIDGAPVVIADGATRLAMPADSAAVSSRSSDVWLVSRSGINVLCINGARPVLIASSLDVDRLLAIAAERNLL